MANSSFHISKDAFLSNLTLVRSSTSAKLLLVVKANAYGHGIELIVRWAREFGVDYFGVVALQEAAAIRATDSETPILNLGLYDLRDVAEYVRMNCDLNVWRLDQVRAAAEAAHSLGSKASLHLKVDIGMGRLGAVPEVVPELALAISQTKNVRLRGLYSHLSEADVSASERTLRQIATFASVHDTIRRTEFGPELAHLANSPGTLKYAEAHFDMVRLGIAGYGLQPDPDTPVELPLRPVGQWETRLLEIRHHRKGSGLSYGSEYVCEEDMPVGVVAVGYADGFRRYPKSVNIVVDEMTGAALPVLGRVCMDHFMLDLRPASKISIGDKLILLSRSPRSIVSADSLASRWGTNNYDVVCNIGPRVRRVESR